MRQRRKRKEWENAMDFGAGGMVAICSVFQHFVPQSWVPLVVGGIFLLARGLWNEARR